LTPGQRQPANSQLLAFGHQKEILIQKEIYHPKPGVSRAEGFILGAWSAMLVKWGTYIPLIALEDIGLIACTLKLNLSIATWISWGGALLPCLEHLIMLNTIFFDFLAGLGINVPNNEEMILICHACTKIHHSTEFK
jgi:hypothetical protein